MGSEFETRLWKEIKVRNMKPFSNYSDDALISGGGPAN